MSSQGRKDSKVIRFPGNAATYNAEQERSENVIGRRIQTARHDRKISIEQFSTILQDYGVSAQKGAIGKWERGESAPNAYQLLAISQALQLGNDLAYFMSSKAGEALNAEGYQRLAEYKELLIASGKYKVAQLFEELQDDEIVLPKAVLRPSAGTGGFLDESSFEPVSFPRSSVPAGADLVMNITGDSMEPVYQDGQLIFVHRCETLNVGDVGIFMHDGEGFIKEYREVDPDPEYEDAFTDSTGVRRMQPVLVSYNKKYPPRVVSPYSTFGIFGKVLN